MVDASLVVATPLLVQRIVDDGILQGDRSLVAWLAVAMAGLAVFTALLSVLMAWLSARIGEGLIFDLRTQVFAHVQRQSMAFFTRTQTGALVSRLNNDVIGAQRAFTSTLSTTVSNVVAAVVVGVTMLALSWRVTLLCLALFPLLLLASRWVSTRLAGLTRQQMDGNADLATMMTERFNVGGALLLKLFGRREEEDASFAVKAGRVRDLGIKSAMYSRVLFVALGLVAATGTAVVYFVGGNLVIDGTIGIGTVWLVGQLADFVERHPEIRISLITGDNDVDLSMREADVAIRLARPTQPDLIQRRLMTVHTHIYGSPTYLERHGTPQSFEDLDSHRLIAYGEDQPLQAGDAARIDETPSRA